MSSLSYLCEYSSESEVSDLEVQVKRKRTKLPPPDLSKVLIVSPETHVDDPDLHGGRTRSFPHVRGNWATFVFVKLSEEEALLHLIETLEERILKFNKSWQRCDNIHVSLSKTFVLNYHIIAPFTSSLQRTLSTIQSFYLDFSSLKVYCNEENTRTFIALQSDTSSFKHLLNLSKKVDEVLIDFKLPTFYKDSSYHTSLFWINGNKVSEANTILVELNDIVYCELEKSLKSVLIDRVSCKSGNKYFQYSLQ